ncbi:MAG TPA: hypothetical protein VJV78_46915 [Polyangiales bacterium]|nr:hypothetical protein [Polyangiales bacterium]
MSIIPKLIWGAVSMALAFGLNVQMHPRYAAPFEAGEPLDQHGTLVLSDPALEVPTLSLHVLAEDFVHMGKRYPVRELSLRSQQARGGGPSFELFVDLPTSVGAIPGRRLDPNALLQLELTVQPTGRLGARSSFVQLPGAEPASVLTGTLQLTDLRAVDDTGQPEVRGEARLELQVEQGRGVQLMTGKWSGRVITE